MPRAPLVVGALAALLPQTAALTEAPGAVPEAHPAAFVEWRLPEGTVFAGQRVPLALRVGLEESLARDRLLPLFAQEVELPVQLDLAWETIGPCVLEDDLEELLASGSATGPELVVAGSRARAHATLAETREGSRFTVADLALPVTLTCSGEVELPAAELAFAWSSEFTTDLFGDRRPTGREVTRVAAAPASLKVAPLPEDGRPPEFAGAVGRFGVESRLLTPSVIEGEHVKLELVVTGAGGLASVTPPPLLPGPFRVFGVTEERSADRVRFLYDLLPDGPGEHRLGSAVLASFDPSGGGRWLREVTEPLTLIVRPDPRGSEETSPVPAEPGPANPLWPWLVVAGSLALVTFLWRLRRVHARSRSPR